MTNKTDYLHNLPDELLVYIGQFLDMSSKSRWSQTSKRNHLLFFKESLDLAKQQLLTHTIRGEANETICRIERHPDRLSAKSTAMDHSDRIFENVTPFQAALLTHDVGLWKKMELYFDKLEDGQAEKAKQFNEVFPNGLPEQKPYDFSALIQVIAGSSESDIQAALRKEQNNTQICSALEFFREEFTALAMQERYFNPQHLIEAYKIYAAQFPNWSKNQSALFWCQVIGFSQRFLPACYAQAFCQGLHLVVEGLEPLERSLKPRNGAASFYPLSFASGLGFDFGIFSTGTYRVIDPTTEKGPPPSFMVNATRTLFEKYVAQIHQSYLDFSASCNVDNSSQTMTPWGI